MRRWLICALLWTTPVWAEPVWTYTITEMKPSEGQTLQVTVELFQDGVKVDTLQIDFNPADFDKQDTNAILALIDAEVTTRTQGKRQAIVQTDALKSVVGQSRSVP